MEGSGGRVTLGTVGIDGKLGFGKDGSGGVLGKDGKVGFGNGAAAGNVGNVVLGKGGNVALGMLGIEGNGDTAAGLGRDGIVGNVGIGACNRLRAAKLTCKLEKKNVATMERRRQWFKEAIV
ncbi:hypothetical protein ACH5RR_013282 [Cinchona calisaya]|uniref:Uncharacterized protein n=1 Tax=Cinchona calisaya TaxID=153742 RepID=A0ABD3A2Z8_9GENT